MTARDELAEVIEAGYGDDSSDCPYDHAPTIADAVLTAGYRKIFDGDCGLSNVKDPTEREAAEAWMRWANLAMNEEIGAIVAMKQMLTEFRYRKPRTISTAEELDALPFEAVIRDAEGHVLERWGEPEESLWTTVMVNAFIPRDDIALPVTVLHDPDAAK